MLRSEISRPQVDRFWDRVKANGDCWEWQGSQTAKGYGNLMVNCESVYAHRFAYTVIHGDIPDGMYVLHHCDNPICVKPSHIYAGTQVDNCRDRDTRGRNGVVVLTDDQVREVRSRVKKANGRRGILAELAREMGVSPQTITTAANGKRYGWVAP